VSFAEFDTAVNRCANAIAAAGVGQGDRVALLSHNCWQYAVLAYATARLGAVLVPVNFMLGPDEIAYILGHAGATAMIAEDALAGTAEKALARGPDRRAARLDRAVRRRARRRGRGGRARPKGVMLSSRSLIAQYVSCAIDGGMAHDDVEVHSLPMYHCAQLDCFFSVDAYLGATSVILPGPDEEKTAEAFRSGWFHSGDLGRIDSDGYLSVVDRKKDMIKTGGENVSSREVEEALYALDGAAEVAVFGVTHPHWIEAVTAVIVPRAGASLRRCRRTPAARSSRRTCGPSRPGWRRESKRGQSAIAGTYTAPAPGSVPAPRAPRARRPAVTRSARRGGTNSATSAGGTNRHSSSSDSWSTIADGSASTPPSKMNATAGRAWLPSGATQSTASSGPTSMDRPISSSTSRAQPACGGSPSSRMPPGRFQWSR
jgi:hypothetical protein